MHQLLLFLSFLFLAMLSILTLQKNTESFEFKTGDFGQLVYDLQQDQDKYEIKEII